MESEDIKDMCNFVNTVYEADGTRYEILVTTIEIQKAIIICNI